jgi:hypothetical protein
LKITHIGGQPSRTDPHTENLLAVGLKLRIGTLKVKEEKVQIEVGMETGNLRRKPPYFVPLNEKRKNRRAL